MGRPSSAPLVSVCVPTRNRASSLRDSIRSICRQDYAHLEIVISDNASDDDTTSVCRELAEEDRRVTYVRHSSNIGLHRNHNFCLDAGRGEYLCVFHDHDRRDDRLIGIYVDFLEAHPDVGVVCSDWDLIDDADVRLGVRDHEVATVTPGLDYITQTIRAGRSSIGIPGAMVRRAALGAARFVPDGPIGFGDFPLWFQVAERADVGHIGERLWSWRQNKESHSARSIHSVAGDFEQNILRYCDEHLARWPAHAAQVAMWRASCRKYLFWALTYEVALHFRRHREVRNHPEKVRSLFEIMDYHLSEEQFERAIEQMKSYRTSPVEYLASGIVQALVRSGMTSPLGWITQYQSTLRGLLRLK